jgi:23S rRNA (uracil1939-C5)-methyltransferase
MELIVDIERILPGGMGFAHADGKTVFVSLAAPGDRVRVTVDREQGKVLFASIKEIITRSSFRVEPPCPYFGRCGGCDFQQLTYEAQLAAKASIIRDCLHRITKLEDAPDFIVEPSPEIWRYRARATWQLDQEKKEVGYYERNSRRVCDVADCAVLVPSLQTTLEQVRNTPGHELPPMLEHLDVVSGDNGVSLATEFAEFQTKELTLRVGEEVYGYNAEAFFQVNQLLLPSLVEFAISDARGETAVDLYCGVGLFTLPLTRRFERVIGVESNPVATRFARRNLQNAGLTNASVETASLSDWMVETEERVKTVDYVLLDPPRAGAESIVIRGILDLQPKRITYVSCDPATLARDLKKLLAGGYALREIRGFDMFPQTHHVETIAHLTL